MPNTNVIRDYLLAHPGETADSEQSLGRVWAWNADRLRAEAHGIMDRLGLPEVLRPLGEVRVVGSVATDLLVKLGIDAYPGPSGDWSIDIMVTDRIERTGFALAERINHQRTAEQRLATLAIKGDCYSRGELKGGISRRIYEAVLDHGVMTREDFRKHVEWNRNASGENGIGGRR